MGSLPLIVVIRSHTSTTWALACTRKAWHCGASQRARHCLQDNEQLGDIFTRQKTRQQVERFEDGVFDNPQDLPAMHIDQDCDAREDRGSARTLAVLDVIAAG